MCPLWPFLSQNGPFWAEIRHTPGPAQVCLYAHSTVKPVICAQLPLIITIPIKFHFISINIIWEVVWTNFTPKRPLKGHNFVKYLSTIKPVQHAQLTLVITKPINFYLISINSIGELLVVPTNFTWKGPLILRDHNSAKIIQAENDDEMHNNA